MLNFEWDLNKAKNYIEKHGIAFEEASTVFGDNLSLIIDDPLHSIGEARLVIIGLSHKNRLLVVAFSERGDNIRIISARNATKKERKNYENNEK